MEHKIIFTGPVGSGKTTAIASISDIPVASTEATASDEVVLRKSNTTVAMDYGLLSLGNNQKMHLYGTPGQERFSFMWDILTVGGVGLVLMIDNARKDPLADIEFFLNHFKDFIKKNAVVIGVTRIDIKPRPGLFSIKKRLQELKYNVPVFEVDARNKQDVKILIISLLAVLDPCVN